MSRDPFASYRYRGLGAVVVVVGLFVFFYGYFNEFLVFMLLGVGVAVAGGLLGKKGQRHGLVDGRELLAKDKRSHILYLRSFADEIRESRPIYVFSAMFGRAIPGAELGMRNMEQQTLGGYLGRIGPYITVGRPGERLPDVGAAWLWITNENWRKEVGKLIRGARLLVIQAGFTDGLRWEFEQLAKSVDPKKILLIVPRKKRDYEQFRGWATALMPKPLPPKMPPSLLIIFDRSWSPIALKPGNDLFQILAPFFKQNNIESPANVIQAVIQDKARRKEQRRA